MNLRRYIKQSLPFLPRHRQFGEALQWLNQKRPGLLQDSADFNWQSDFGIDPTTISHLSPARLKQILEILTYTEFDDTFNPDKIPDFYFTGDFAADDTIHNEVIRKLIIQGHDLMKTTRDPAHGLTHAVRVCRIARLLYDELRLTEPNLDWGIIATACVWHDVWRADHLGFLYSKDTVLRKLLRQIDILQDVVIYSIDKQDSIGSAMAFLKQSRWILAPSLSARIAIAILGEHRLKKLEERFYPGINLYKKIVLCADTIDLFTIGRWEEMHRKVIYWQQTDKTYIDRMIVLNALFNIKGAIKKIDLPLAVELRQISEQVMIHYGEQFYPNDAKLLKRVLANIKK